MPRGPASNDFDCAARHFEDARQKIDQLVVGLASSGGGIERDHEAARIEANDTPARRAGPRDDFKRNETVAEGDPRRECGRTAVRHPTGTLHEPVVVRRRGVIR